MGQTRKDFIQASEIHSELLFRHCSCYSDTRGVTIMVGRPYFVAPYPWTNFKVVLMPLESVVTLDYTVLVSKSW
jgi:hypothetical protein